MPASPNPRKSTGLWYLAEYDHRTYPNSVLSVTRPDGHAQDSQHSSAQKWRLGEMQDVRLLERSSWATEMQETRTPKLFDLTTRTSSSTSRGQNFLSRLGKMSPTAEFSAS